MPLYPFEGNVPQIEPDVFVAPTAAIIGRVTLAEHVSVWFGAVLRGDEAPISIGPRSNIQDNCVIHGETHQGTWLGSDVTVGHGAILHDCTIGDNVLIGMGAIILSGTTIGAGAIVAAGAVVKEKSAIPPNVLVAGCPATIKGPLSPNSQNWSARAAEDYLRLVARYRDQPG